MNCLRYKIQNIIDSHNTKIVMEYGGSQDALYDINWAWFKGYPVTDIDGEAIDYIANVSNNDNVAIKIVKEILSDKILYVDLEVAKKYLLKNLTNNFVDLETKRKG